MLSIIISRLSGFSFFATFCQGRYDIRNSFQSISTWLTTVVQNNPRVKASYTGKYLTPYLKAKKGKQGKTV